MPISTLDGCSADHWAEVKAIIADAVDSIEEPRFSARMVSDADEIGVIQKRIVQNVYSSDIIVCDVSGKNPNVMFELGMRLAFDKPVVIVKDDKTDYSFDTGIIEHVTYPRDLRFSRIVDFKHSLTKKIASTYLGSAAPDSSPFLKNFGRFQVASLQQTEVSPDRLVLEMLDDIRREMHMLRRRVDTPKRPRYDSYVEDESMLLRRVVKFVREIASNGSVAPNLMIGDPHFYDLVRSTCAPAESMPTAEFNEMVDRVVKLVAETELGLGVRVGAT
jgi:hypothetical protein